MHIIVLLNLTKNLVILTKPSVLVRVTCGIPTNFTISSTVIYSVATHLPNTMYTSNMTIIYKLGTLFSPHFQWQTPHNTETLHFPFIQAFTFRSSIFTAKSRPQKHPSLRHGHLTVSEHLEKNNSWNDFQDQSEPVLRPKLPWIFERHYRFPRKWLNLKRTFDMI